MGLAGRQRANTQRGGGGEAEGGVTHAQGDKILLQEDPQVPPLLLQRRRLPAQGEALELDLMILAPELPEPFVCSEGSVSLEWEGGGWRRIEGVYQSGMGG